MLRGWLAEHAPLEQLFSGTLHYFNVQNGVYRKQPGRTNIDADATSPSFKESEPPIHRLQSVGDPSLSTSRSSRRNCSSVAPDGLLVRASWTTTTPPDPRAFSRRLRRGPDDDIRFDVPSTTGPSARCLETPEAIGPAASSQARRNRRMAVALHVLLLRAAVLLRRPQRRARRRARRHAGSRATPRPPFGRARSWAASPPRVT